MVQENIPNKRNLLYEMLLKLSGVEKRITLSEDEIKKEISEIENNYKPFLASFSQFLQILIKNIHQHFKEKVNLDKIDNIAILESVYQDIKNFEFQNEKLKEEHKRLVNLLEKQILRLEASKLEKEEATQDIDQLLQYLLINLSKIDKKIKKILPKESSEPINQFNILIGEIRTILNSISSFDNEERITDLILQIKNLNTKLKYKEASVSVALISRGFKQGRISLQTFLSLLKTKIHSEIIRATIILTLKNFGTLSLEQIAEKTEIKPKELLKNCISLLHRKEISINTSNHVNYYKLIRDYPKLYRFISKEIFNLKVSKDRLSITSRSLLTATLSIADSILEKILKIGNESDKIYNSEIQNLNEILNKLHKALKPKYFNQEQKSRQHRISALIELFNMFRVKMVHEKEVYLIEQSGDKNKEKQLDNFILATIKMDFERGLLLSILKTEGPLIIQDLAKLSNIPQNKIVQHVLKLIKDKIIITKGTKNGYFLYDIPRTLAKFEIIFQNTFNPFVKIVQAFINLSQNKYITLDKIPQISNELKNVISNLSKLLKIEFESDIREEIQLQLEHLNIIITQYQQLEKKLPKTKSSFDLTKLAMMSLPRIDEKHADLIEPQYLVGFGDIEWDINKCLACASCQTICPESAINLVNIWDLPATFEMSKEELDNIPENRKKLIQLIKKLAVKKPTKSIKLPKDTLGFGKIEYNPLICIACRKCETRCPNSALTFHEFWNFPQIMRTLLEEG